MRSLDSYKGMLKGSFEKTVAIRERLVVAFLACSLTLVGGGTSNSGQQTQPSGTLTAVPVSALMADRHVNGIAGAVGVRLDAQQSYKLQGITIGGREYTNDGGFPTFTVLDQQGRQATLAPTDGQWQIQMQRQSAIPAVMYKAHGLAVEVRYIAEGDQINIVAKVLSEGDWKLISLGGTLLSRTVATTSQEDYLVDGSGRLVFPDVQKVTEEKWDANIDNTIGGVTAAAFVAWREKDRIVFVKPLTFSHWLGWLGTPQREMTKFALDTGLYFRPRETKLFQTKLAHETLALRIETAGDVNHDGELNWVDAGIVYRERYIKPHKIDDLHHRIRDAFRVYYAVHDYHSYDEAFAGLSDIEFADGIWWLKGMMEPATREDWESHKFVVEPNLKLGALEPWKRKMNEARQWIGPYYGNDYIVLKLKDWPDEFIKRNPNNQPYPYSPASGRSLAKFYKDNVRSVATGAVFKHYEKILKVCLIQRGDPIMLDTFSAFARSGYHPQFPATPELETEAKHRIAAFMRDEKGLVLAGEGLVEGLQDIVDYGAIAFRPVEAVRGRIWERRDGIQRVPMLPVVFQGSGYYGAGWYEFRQPNPNWAVGLVYGVGYWDWLPQGPQNAWMRFARYYFNQNLIWAQVADAKVRDVQIKGSEFTITYEDGATLWTDISANRWVLDKDGIHYDGFTPFNNRGYMAVLAQGDFEFVLPGEHRLEISPNQPFREQIMFQSLVNDGQTIIKGRFGNLKWRIPLLKVTPDRKEISEPYDATSVLVLRKIR